LTFFGLRGSSVRLNRRLFYRHWVTSLWGEPRWINVLLEEPVQPVRRATRYSNLHP
jgi:hypothetical protein